MHLAQINDIPAEFIKWVVVLAVGLLAASGGWAGAFFARNRKIKPQPLDVRKVDTFMTREFCNTHHIEINRRLEQHDMDIRGIYAELKADRERHERHTSERSAGLYKRIEDVRMELSDKVDSMPDRIIETLNKLHLLNTGGKK